MTANRMIVGVGCLFLLVLAMDARARIMPSFHLESSVWPATDIVLASQVDGAAGEVTVLETWKGTLTKGATIQVVGLPAAPIQISTRWGNRPPPESVSGQRIVLFLKPATPKEGETPTTRPAGTLFEGTASYGGAQVSAVWIEDTEPFAFVQRVNPGPTELHPLGQTEVEFVKETFVILDVKDQLSRIAKLDSSLDRARALVPMTRSRYWHARKEAFALLGQCGGDALPLLRKMLRDEAVDQSDVVRALAAAAGADAGKELAAILQDELAYWKSVGPSLKPGWWNAGPEDQRKVLQAHYNVLQNSLRALANAPDHPAREVVTQLRELWLSLPQLNDRSGVNAIVEECERAMKTAR